MRTISLLLFGALFALGISASAQNSNTIVTGRVINRTADDPAVITWNLCDPVVNDRMGVRLAEDGTFRFETDGIPGFITPPSITVNSSISSSLPAIGCRWRSTQPNCVAAHPTLSVSAATTQKRTPSYTHVITPSCGL